MILKSIPDAKNTHKFLKVDTDYEIDGILGNGYVIHGTDDTGETMQIVILQT